MITDGNGRSLERSSAKHDIAVIVLVLGASFCALIGIVTILFLSRAFSLEEYYVVEKHTQHVGASVEYFLLAKQPDVYGSLNGFGLDNRYSKSFYDRAVLGDLLRSSMLYSQLVRGGRVIKRDFSEDFIFFGCLGLFAFLPLACLLVFQKSRAKITVGVCVGIMEAITIWLFLFTFILVD